MYTIEINAYALRVIVSDLRKSVEDINLFFNDVAPTMTENDVDMLEPSFKKIQVSIKTIESYIQAQTQ